MMKSGVANVMNGLEEGQTGKEGVWKSGKYGTGYQEAEGAECTGGCWERTKEDFV